jgi:predicted phosphodiesterase
VVRIGLLSDVHGNITALDAVARALAQHEPLDAVVVAGDLLWGGARPAEVWDRLTIAGWILVRGNADETIAADTVDDDFPQGSPYRHSAERLHAWTRERLDLEVPRALAALPFEHRLSTSAGDLLVVHSSPRGTRDRRGGPHNTAEEATAAYTETGASAIAFGHWHASFVRVMPFGLLINVASVGLPLDGLPLAAYTILTASKAGWTVEQRRVPYDFALEERAALEAGKPAWTPEL